jgi:hypothetical protein
MQKYGERQDRAFIPVHAKNPAMVTQSLKKIKYSVNDCAENNHHQYHNENQLFGVEFFHESSEL